MKLSRAALTRPVLERPETIDTLELPHLRAVAHGLVELLVKKAERKPGKRKPKAPAPPRVFGPVAFPHVVFIPGFKLGRGGNDRLMPFAAKRQKDNEKRVTRLALGHCPPAETVPWKLRVTMTRIAHAGLDTDNLAGAFKYVRDEVARWIGTDDGPNNPRMEWICENRSAAVGVYHVVIRIEARP